jgi:hypothetical protein
LRRAAARSFPGPQVLQESDGDLAQERVVVQAAPPPAFEVVEAEFSRLRHIQH